MKCADFLFKKKKKEDVVKRINYSQYILIMQMIYQNLFCVDKLKKYGANNCQEEEEY